MNTSSIGFVKLHRQFLNWEWYDDINTKVLFLHLLLKANFKDKNWQGIEIKRGQLLTSVQHLAIETQLSVQQVRTSLDKLASTQEINKQTTSRYTLVGLVNYNEYQTNNKQITNKQQTDNKRITTTKEVLTEQEREEGKEIIDYLNLKTGKNFRTSESNKKLINARLNEKYNLEDFKKVIDIKSQEWLETEMSKFLRPSTLFRGSNFENYINQENTVTKQTLINEFREIGFNKFKKKYGQEKAITTGDLIEQL